MKKMILSLGMFFFLTACSNSDDKSGTGPGGNGKGGIGDGNTKSDVFAVSKGSAVNTNSFWGIWESQQISVSGIKLRIRIQFDASRMTMASECIYPDGITLYAQVGSYATYYGNEVTTYDTKEDLAVYQNAGKEYTCSASVEADTQEINIINGKIQGEDFTLTKVSN